MLRFGARTPFRLFSKSKEIVRIRSAPSRSLNTLPSLEIFRRAIKHQERRAVINNPDTNKPEAQKTFTYADLLEHSEALHEDIKKSGLLKENEGDPDPPRIAVLCEAGYDYVRAQWAIWRAGGIFVPLCTTHPAAEMEYILQNARVSGVLCDDKHWDMLNTLAKKNHVQVLHLDAANPEYKKLSHTENIKEYKIDNKQPAMIIYTSGTTGKPKGVVTSHSNIQAQVMSMYTPWGWNADDHILHVLPLHHLHGIINVLTCCMWSGAVCEMMPKFNDNQVWERILQRGRNSEDTLNLFMAVPTIYSRLLHRYENADQDSQKYFRSVCERYFRLMVSGSAALPESVMKKWKDASGHILLERYGMSEIGMALSNPLHGIRHPGAVGLALPGVEVGIFDEKSGNKLNHGEQGEVRVKGDTVFMRYWDRPDATEDTFDDNHWFKTGDIGVYDIEKSTYRLLGRASVDIIKSGGYKISALDIERELLEHPYIKEIAVVGIPDEEYGQVIGAIVVLSEGNKMDYTVLKDWAKNKMAGYKIPRRLLVVEEMPRNAMGKTNKKELVKLFK